MNIQMRADFTILKGELCPWIEEGFHFLQVYKRMASDLDLAPYFYRLRRKKNYFSWFQTLNDEEFKSLLLEVVYLLSKPSFTEKDAERIEILFNPESRGSAFPDG